MPIVSRLHRSLYHDAGDLGSRAVGIISSGWQPAASGSHRQQSKNEIAYVGVVCEGYLGTSGSKNF